MGTYSCRVTVVTRGSRYMVSVNDCTAIVYTDHISTTIALVMYATMRERKLGFTHSCLHTTVDSLDFKVRI